MRRYFALAASALAFASLVSCIQEIPDPEQTDIIQLSERQVTLVADLGDETQTKTAYDEEHNKIYWQPAEELSLFYGSGDFGGSKFTSTNTEESRVANFTGTINVITAGDEITEDDVYFWGLYPYNGSAGCDGHGVITQLPAVQTAVAGGFADKLYITAGRSTGLKMGFKAVCSALVFTVQHEGIARVVLSGNNSEILAGTFSFGFNDANLPIVNGHDTSDSKNQVTLLAPDGGTFTPGVNYYVITLPAEFTQGMKMTFYKADGSFGIKKWDTPITFARNMFTHANLADRSVEFNEAVDLGLPTKWAPHNVGAIDEMDYGDYFAWGETIAKDEFAESNYVSPGLDALDLAHDAANASWGGTWRMPTIDDWYDLIDYCTWTEYPGQGYLVESRINGNSIILPYAGQVTGTNCAGKGASGYYWASDWKAPFLINPSRHIFSGSSGDAIAYLGRSVRPVQTVMAEKLVIHGTESDDWDDRTIHKRNVVTLQADVTPSYAPVTWTTSNASVVNIQSTDKATATIVGTGVGSANVTVTSANGLSVTWLVTVQPELATLPEAYDGRDDLWGEYAWANKGVYHWSGANKNEVAGELMRQTQAIEFVPHSSPQSGVNSWVANTYQVEHNGESPIYMVFEDNTLSFVTTANTFHMFSGIDFFNGFLNLGRISGLEYLDIDANAPLDRMFKDCYSLSELKLGTNFDFTGKTRDNQIFDKIGADGGQNAWTTFDCDFITWTKIHDDLLITTDQHHYYWKYGAQSASLSSTAVSQLVRGVAGDSGPASIEHLVFRVADNSASSVSYAPGSDSQTIYASYDSGTKTVNIWTFGNKFLIEGDNGVSMFNAFEKLKSIEGLEYFDTSNATSLNAMFSFCSALTSLDLSTFSTTRVTDFRYMFYRCDALEYLDFGGIWCSAGSSADRDYMFSETPSLKYLKLSSMFSNLAGTEGVFDGTGSQSTTTNEGALTVDCVDAVWNNIRSYFADGQCVVRAKNAYMPQGSDFNSTILKSIIGNDYSVLKSVEFKYNTPPPTGAQVMFRVNEYHNHPMYALFDSSTGKLTITTDASVMCLYKSCYMMFASCSELASVTGLGSSYAGNVDDSEVQYLNSMFYGCKKLTSIDLRALETRHVTNMAGMFMNCEQLWDIDISTFHADSLTNMDFMFSGLSGRPYLLTTNRAIHMGSSFAISSTVSHNGTFEGMYLNDGGGLYKVSLDIDNDQTFDLFETWITQYYSGIISGFNFYTYFRRH